MTGAEYTQALASLSLTPEQAATWLGIGRSTAYRYLKTGCEGPVGVAIEQRLAFESVNRPLTVWEIEDACSEMLDGVGCTPWENDSWDRDGSDGASRDGVRGSVVRVAEFVSKLRHSDLTAAVGVGS